jgi:hypothetical protein
MKNKLTLFSNWISKNVINLFILAIVFSLSSSPGTKNISEQNLDVICELENQVNEMALALNQINSSINEPFSLAARYKADVVGYKKFLKEERMYPSTKFRLQSYVKDKNTDISRPLLAALIAYSRFESAPQEIMYVNSAKRDGNPFSRHYTGNAIDIHFECGDEFLNWLDSTDGRNWLIQYQLYFYIEDSYSSSKFLAPWRLRLGENIFVNPKATGPHVHLEYVGKNK